MYINIKMYTRTHACTHTLTHTHTQRYIRKVFIPSQDTSWQAAWIGLNYSWAKRNKQWGTKYFSMAFNNWTRYLKRDTEKPWASTQRFCSLSIIHYGYILVHMVIIYLTTAIEFCNSYFFSYGLVNPLPECQTETTVLHSAQIIFLYHFMENISMFTEMQSCGL